MGAMKRTLEAKMSSVLAGSLPIRLHLRTDLHLARKVWHMSMGLMIAVAYLAGFPRTTAVIFLSSVLGLDLLVEMARLRMPSVNEKVMRYWGLVMRSSEVNRLSGVPYYLAATILAIGIFPKPIAVLSIVYLAFGDPIASMIGILYGQKSVRLASGKSLIGTSAGVITCALLTFLFVTTLHLPDSAVWILTLVGGLAGGTAELLPLEVDDNFSIPVVSGFVLWFAFILLGI